MHAQLRWLSFVIVALIGLVTACKSEAPSDGASPQAPRTTEATAAPTPDDEPPSPTEDTGVGGTGPVEDTAPEAVEQPELPPPDETRAVELDIELTPGTTVRVGAELPAAFAGNERSPAGTYRLPPAALGLGEYDSTATLALDAQCNGMCDPAEVVANIAGYVESARRSARQPNVGTGDPARDAVRADVTELVAEIEPERVVLVQRIEYSQAVLDSGPYRPHISLTCAARAPGAGWFAVLNGRLEPGLEATWLEPMTDACRSVRAVIEATDE